MFKPSLTELNFWIKQSRSYGCNANIVDLLKLFALILIGCSSCAHANDDFVALASKCAPSVSTDTLKALVQTESSFNPYAIGVVGGSVKQPKSFQEAMITIAKLESEGKNYSVGLGQINKSNFKAYGINAEKALDACTNLKVTAQILGDCYQRAGKQGKTEKQTLKDALSCYYSGNFRTGYEHGYVNKVEKHASATVSVPSLVHADDLQESPDESIRTSERKLIF